MATVPTCVLIMLHTALLLEVALPSASAASTELDQDAAACLVRCVSDSQVAKAKLAVCRSGI